MNEDEGAGFYALGDRLLARHGVPGDPVAVYCHGDTLLLRGEGGPEFRLPAAAIERLRLGFAETKYSRFQIARIFLTGEAEPLVIHSRDSRAPAYATTMRRFARAVVAAHGSAALERGLTDRAARTTTLVESGVAIVFAAMAVLVWSREAGSLGAAVFVAVLAALAASFAWYANVFEAPHPLASLDEAEKYLR